MRRRHYKTKVKTPKYLSNLVLLWVLALFVNFAIMFIGDLIILSFSRFALFVLYIVILIIIYIDSCLATVDIRKRIKLSWKTLVPNRMKLGLTSIISILVLILRF